MIRSKTDTPVFQLSGLPGKNMLNLYSCTQKCGLALRECKMYVKCKPLHGEFAPVQTVFFYYNIYVQKNTVVYLTFGLLANYETNIKISYLDSFFFSSQLYSHLLGSLSRKATRLLRRKTLY